MTDAPVEYTPEQKSIMRGFVTLLALEATGYVTGLAVTGYLVKTGIVIATESGFDHRVAGVTTLAAGGYAFYRVFRGAASEVAALCRLGRKTDVEATGAATEEVPARPRGSAPDMHNPDRSI